MNSESTDFQDLPSEEIMRQNLKSRLRKSKPNKRFIDYDEDEDDEDNEKPVKTVKCKICGNKFVDVYGLRTHMKIHTNTELFSCTLCSYQGKTQKYLTRHFRRHKEPTHECRVCGKMYHFKSKLTDHMMVHTGEKPYTCKVCGKAFRAKYSYDSHCMIHTNTKPYKCMYCAYACRDNSTLRKHQERHMGRLKMYQCTYCVKRYDSKSHLKDHVALKHFSVDVRMHECLQCEKKFKNKNNLKKHVEAIHDRSMRCKCDICGQELTNRLNLPAHLRSHINVRPFKCSYKKCRKKFKDKGALKRHEITHNPARQIPCPLCDKLFARRTRLNSHLRMHGINKGLKRFQCDHCGMGFNQRDGMVRHIYKHMYNRHTYVCEICKFVTHRKNYMALHMTYGHGPSDDLLCRICNKTFRLHSKLTAHYYNRHNVAYRTVETIKTEDPIKIKEEPGEPVPDLEIDLFEVEKHEPFMDMNLDYEDTYSKTVLTEDVVSSMCHSAEGPEKVIDDLFRDTLTEKTAECMEVENSEINLDKDKEEYVRRKIKKMLDRGRQKEMLSAIDEMRQIYNERIRAMMNSNIEKETLKIKFINMNKEKTDHNKNTSEQDNEINSEANEGDGNIDTSEKDSNRRKETNCKLKINMQQCHICYQLFESEAKLIEHCQIHFDICSYVSLKKCPLCEYVTNLTITKHLKNKHNININIPYQRVCEKNKNSQKSKYFYDVNSSLVKEIEIIPSIKNLNKIAGCKIDKNNRNNKNKFIAKTKLVKKGNEWVVVNEKIDLSDINRYILPKFDDINVKAVGSTYLTKLQVLSHIAKKKGMDFLYPCENCEKICQTFSALKLHSRKHERNPKPFKKKVWKHRKVLSKGKNKKEAKILESGAVNLKSQANKCVSRDKNLKRYNTEAKNVVSKADKNNRYENPKPIVNNHKCDEKLKEFYENNIKGGDIEFWQFLKIYNKMDREQITDFKDLENRTDFGIHIPDKIEENTLKITNKNIINNIKTNKICKIKNVMVKSKKYIGNKVNKKYVRKIFISKNEYMMRLQRIEMLRKKMAEESSRN